MRELKKSFAILSVASMSLFCTSCPDPEPDEPLSVFIEYTNAQTFYDTYNAYTGEKALIDYRSIDKYEAGHLEGAVNLPATVYNTDDDNAQWCKDLKAMYPTSTCLFFYGVSSFEMNKTVAGRASKIGYGKNNSRIYSKGYDGLKDIWK